MSSPLPTLRLLPGQSGPVRHGRPWIYSNQVAMDVATRAIAPGTQVAVVDDRGRPLGVAHYNPHTLIAARMLGRGEAAAAAGPVQRDGYEVLLARALALRTRLFDVPHYRLVHAEGDGLPGLVIDRYGDVLSVQANTAGAERDLPLILEALQRVLAPAGVVLRLDSAARALEGLETRVEVLGRVPPVVPVLENDLTYRADLVGGQKTGWFFDHRANRRLAARLATGARVLDLYSYGGGFALASAAAGAAQVVAVDRSAAALALAEQAAADHGLGLETAVADVFDWLEAQGQPDGRRFDLVIADPPAFAKSARSVPTALRGYRKLARLSAAVAAPGAGLLIASCSHAITAEALLKEAVRGIADAGRAARLLASRGADVDHPIHPQLPESAYLKALLFALDG